MCGYCKCDISEDDLEDELEYDDDSEGLSFKDYEEMMLPEYWGKRDPYQEDDLDDFDYMQHIHM